MGATHMRLWKVVSRIVRGRNSVGVEAEGFTAEPGGIGLAGMKKGVLGAGALRGEGMLAGVMLVWAPEGGQGRKRARIGDGYGGISDSKFRAQLTG